MVELTQSFMIPLVWLLILQFILREGCLLLQFRFIAIRLRSLTTTSCEFGSEPCPTALNFVLRFLF